MEPLMQVDVTCPEEYMGDVLGDINSRRGIVGDLGERGNAKTISAQVPLANMFQYVSTLRSMSKGRANYSMKLASYDFVPPNIEKELTEGFKLAEEEESVKTERERERERERDLQK
jgi:elongation factor G